MGGTLGRGVGWLAITLQNGQAKQLSAPRFLRVHLSKVTYTPWKLTFWTHNMKFFIFKWVIFFQVPAFQIPCRERTDPTKRESRKSIDSNSYLWEGMCDRSQRGKGCCTRLMLQVFSKKRMDRKFWWISGYPRSRSSMAARVFRWCLGQVSEFAAEKMIFQPTINFLRCFRNSLASLQGKGRLGGFQSFFSLFLYPRRLRRLLHLKIRPIEIWQMIWTIYLHDFRFKMLDLQGVTRKLGGNDPMWLPWDFSNGWFNQQLANWLFNATCVRLMYEIISPLL